MQNAKVFADKEYKRKLTVDNWVFATIVKTRKEWEKVLNKPQVSFLEKKHNCNVFYFYCDDYCKKCQKAIIQTESVITFLQLVPSARFIVYGAVFFLFCQLSPCCKS